MPTVLRLKGYRFFFFSLEGNEPPHIHVERGDGYAKFWLTDTLLARSKGFKSKELTELRRMVRRNRDHFERSWHEHFSG